MESKYEVITHDKINRYLKNEKLTPSLLWDNVKELVEREENACLIFDDTVIDKRYSEEIDCPYWATIPKKPARAGFVHRTGIKKSFFV
jgi:hypothetical protein